MLSSITLSNIIDHINLYIKEYQNTLPNLGRFKCGPCGFSASRLGNFIISILLESHL